MFIVTIPCDSHKRLEKSTSTLPPLLCTLPTLLPLPPPQSLKAQLRKEKKGWGRKKSKFVVKRSRIVVLSVCFRLRSLLDKQSVVLRCNKEWRKTPVCGWRVWGGGGGGPVREGDETRCAAKRFLTKRLQGGTQFVLFLFFKVAKIIQKPKSICARSG